MLYRTGLDSSSLFQKVQTRPNILLPVHPAAPAPFACLLGTGQNQTKPNHGLIPTGLAFGRFNACRKQAVLLRLAHQKCPRKGNDKVQVTVSGFPLRLQGCNLPLLKNKRWVPELIPGPAAGFWEMQYLCGKTSSKIRRLKILCTPNALENVSVPQLSWPRGAWTREAHRVEGNFWWTKPL